MEGEIPQNNVINQEDHQPKPETSQVQTQIVTTMSNNNAKFPYLKKDEYEV